MKTTPPVQLANVVNGSVTIFFQSVQRLTAAPTGARLLVDGRRPMLKSSIGGFNPPLDLVHLARQCLGDRELQAELLELFWLQAPALTAQLCGHPPLSWESRGRIAHTLRGSALAVGARRVAAAAGRIEELASGTADQRSAVGAAIAALQSAVAEALAEIDRTRS